MEQSPETFFTTIGCMDGRVQEPVIAFGRTYFGAKYPDTITRAGLDGEFSIRLDTNKHLLKSLKKKLDVSITSHHSKGIIVHGHEECVGNPVSEDVHKDNIRSTIQVIKQLIPESIPIIGVYVKRNREGPMSWICEEVPQTLLT